MPHQSFERKRAALKLKPPLQPHVPHVLGLKPNKNLGYSLLI